jgi:plasmid stabilization system protein ParE
MSQGPPVWVHFHRLAAQEYLHARRWYSRHGALAARRFTNAIDQALQRIKAAPQAGPVYRGAFRWVAVGRFPYIIYYRMISSTEVLIVAVAHQRRRPGYWIRRSPP